MTVFKTFWIKLTHWEHWPTPLIYLPVFIYYSWLSIKSCDFFFFTAANPGMEMGGLYNTSKFRQLHYLPKRLIPKTIIFDPFSTLEEISKSLRINQLTFPLVCKPDRGERGKGVALINDLNELETYLVSCTTEFLVQEFIDYPLEAGVFFL